jgi:hypothetical protein
MSIPPPPLSSPSLRHCPTDYCHPLSLPPSLSPFHSTQAAVKDKSALQAEVASLQKINMNLARGKNVLEARVNTHAVYVICTLTSHDAIVS